MSSAKVIKHKAVETKTRPAQTKTRTVETKPKSYTNPSKKRAASCPRCNHSNECEATKTSAADRGTKTKNQTKPKQTNVTASPKLQHTASDQKDRSRHMTIYELPSHKAFTVIAPNPKKRREIQKKAEAELAALEDLRLSRAMGYVSIAPSTVGGCLTLEEVRNKQQEEMQMSRKVKQVKRGLPETSVPHK
ncbi:uncharacterized protein zgc:194621 [Megalops cyprinoides]|uniref:uncharacterized protein zgc:194621 n=1 Tax=Megalops cyprinoides TaxID=118141 RepID=UPI001864248A|nr:uncharacterized protein zgc:194621 [Megalops cyprinoides]